MSPPEGIVYHVLVLLIFYYCLLLRELFIMWWPCLYAIIVFSWGNCFSCVGPVDILSLSSPEGIVYHVFALLIFYHCLLLRELFIMCLPCWYSIIFFSWGNCLSCVGSVNILSLSSPEGIVYHVLALLIFYYFPLLRELFSYSVVWWGIKKKYGVRLNGWVVQLRLTCRWETQYMYTFILYNSEGRSVDEDPLSFI